MFIPNNADVFSFFSGKDLGGKINMRYDKKKFPCMVSDRLFKPHCFIFVLLLYHYLTIIIIIGTIIIIGKCLLYRFSDRNNTTLERENKQTNRPVIRPVDRHKPDQQTEIQARPTDRQILSPCLTYRRRRRHNKNDSAEGDRPVKHVSDHVA